MTAANATQADSSTRTADPQDDAQKLRDKAGDSARGSWKFSLDHVQEGLQHVAEEARQLLLWAFAWCIDSAHPLHFDEFCARVGYSDNTIYKIYTGKYKHPTTKEHLGVPKELLVGLRNFQRMERSRSKMGTKKFVMTPTAKRIFDACDLARESQTPVIIEGASHIGKTESYTQYTDLHNHGATRLIQIQASCGVAGLIRATGNALGYSARGNINDVTARIFRSVTKDMLLIFDEMHLLSSTMQPEAFRKCVEWIRRLYDMTQCGIVLSFTKIGYAKAERERKDALDQFFRRGVHRFNLGDGPSVKDVAALLQAWGLEFLPRNELMTVTLGKGTRKAEFTESPYKMLGQLAREQGLKAIIERLRYATKFAADDDEALAWEHVIRAHLIIQRNAEMPDGGWNN